MKNPTHISKDSVADLIFHLKWKSSSACHTDVYHASHVNLWRDHLPPELTESLVGKETGDRLFIPLDVIKGKPFIPENIFDVKTNQFDSRFRKKDEGAYTPRTGRFYPKGMLKGITGIFKTNEQPFRCVGRHNGLMTVDLNHPLAGMDLELSVIAGNIGLKRTERGGTSVDWIEVLMNGPGMQARWKDHATDYFSDDAFRRDDESPDTYFYKNPRYVHHIDQAARELISNTYGRFLTDGMNVLDLMSSWQSHLPSKVNLDQLVGLGLNEDELKRNLKLNQYIVHDLNADATLPFQANCFDAVINTVSVEYITNPRLLFREVSRILRPEGLFIVTFSNRWFPPKTIKIWPELHDFERMGLILEYFMGEGRFKDLHTYSMRGVPRPQDDPYFPDLLLSDPVYAVWGKKS